jgi:N-acetylated-alpha-linked acidic dipeptidase
MGNHRDAWIAGGAGDPNSGSAAFNEVIRSFGIALQAGWKPLRTIVLASWDGEEYGLVGSTEWVEEYLPWLSSSTIAYLNVDVGTQGPHFKASAAPLLNKVLIETRKSPPSPSSLCHHTRILIRTVDLIASPNQTTPGQTVGQVWDKHIATMGSGSDFTAFQDFAGIPSLDIGFGGGPESPVYHYHSNYDSEAWMEKYGDPSFAYHETIAKVWAVLAARIVETPVVQFSATGYAEGLRKYVDTVKEKATQASASKDEVDREGDEDIFASLDSAISHFHFASRVHDALAAQLLDSLYHNDIPWWKVWEKLQLYYAVRKVNTKYKLLERKFLYPDGLDGRPWFKHIVFAPGKWTGYSGATFPGIVEGIEDDDELVVKKWICIAEVAVNSAADWLEEE